ncbi:MAG: vanadium-dependent haloperoxidase [Gemmatimonadaceae bacterium]|nr:vanadium-dependent haloperoxidase [Gemmatimonadaceae bacterium]
MASRFYALLSVAPRRAVDAVDAGTRARGGGRRPELVHAAVVAASAEMLSYLFPARAAAFRETERGDLAALASPRADGSELAAVRQLGADAARAVIRTAATDGADAIWAPLIPTGAGKWIFDPAIGYPLRPEWGRVRPWLMTTGSQFRPSPPPAFGSDVYRAALAEVRAISDTRTAEQLRIAIFWSDGAGTVTPPGHWNAIASQLAERYSLDERRSTQMFALLNMALMDAGIGCWDAKYTYWLIRPSQADPLITTPVGLPNFPSYVSGHAAFSGAAATVLGEIFPSARGDLEAMAEQAAMSRLYGGIHYRFDNEQGLALGRRVGALAVARLRGSASGAP